MATQSLITDVGLNTRRSIMAPRAVKSRPERYELNVVGSSVVDIVSSVGGWLFDRALAGWTVNVVVAGHHDVRPLHILGARALDLESKFASVMRSSHHAAALAVEATTVATDERVQNTILKALDGAEPRSHSGATPRRSICTIESTRFNTD